MSETVHFKDFTKKRVPVRFKIDDDVFECVTALLPAALQEIVTKFRGEEFTEALKSRDVDRVMKGISEIFEIFLLEDSYAVFTPRLSDPKNPIDIHQVIEIVEWIIEAYVSRPTEPSPNSSTGSELVDGGTSSTAGASPDESIPLSSMLDPSWT